MIHQHVIFVLALTSNFTWLHGGWSRRKLVCIQL